MSVGAWDPAAAGSRLELPWLRALAARCAAGVETAGDVRQAVGEAALVTHAGLMRRDEAEWAGIVAELSNAELEQLARFFTLAEKMLPGWEAGARSPVVPLARALRARNAWPATLTAWIRAHTDNRFLPYGSVNR